MGLLLPAILSMENLLPSLKEPPMAAKPGRSFLCHAYRPLLKNFKRSILQIRARQRSRHFAADLGIFIVQRFAAKRVGQRRDRFVGWKHRLGNG